MSFAIVADLPLGSYRGHVGDGQVDRVPSPARLASALLCAAASGPRAVVDGDVLYPCADDLAALHWLEQHPPDGMRIPPVHVNRPDGIAFRVQLLEKSTFVKKAKPMDSVAMGGQLAWTWHKPPAPAIRASLEALCPDVSHLGMAETPVRLYLGEAEPTHDLELDAPWWEQGLGDLDVAVPADGRADALLGAHRDHVREPARSRDEKVRVNEVHRRPPRVSANLAPARYRARRRPAPATPWVHALLATLDRAPHPDLYVQWANQVRRALISLIGYGAPGVLHGRYAEGVVPPANRCAVHLLDPDTSRRLGRDRAATLLLLIPGGIDAGDLATVARAWRRLLRVNGPGGRQVVLRDRADLPGDEFWPAVPPGHRRLWRTVPAAVPEARAQQHGWSLADAVLLSVGMVFRDRLPVGSGRGKSWYCALVEAVRDKGARVEAAVRVRDGDLSRFVHRTHEHLTLHPYQAVVDLGELGGNQTVLALGQSRHLGCGLLVPMDLPVSNPAGVAR